MTTKIHLYDLGVFPKKVEFQTEEAALASFDVHRAHHPYTDALIETNNKVTHTAKRVVGEQTWTIKARPVKVA